MILDTRFNLQHSDVRLSALENRLLVYLDKIRTSKAIETLGRDPGWNADRDVMQYVGELKSQQFVVSEGHRYLSVIPLQNESQADQLIAETQRLAQSASGGFFCYRAHTAR